MRILFVTRKFPPSVGGMEIYSKHLFEAMQAEGADVVLHKPGKDLRGRPSLLELCGFFLHACRRLFRDAGRFDAVLIGDYAIAILAPVAKLASRGRLRTAVSLHGNDLYFLRSRSPLSIPYRQLSRWVTRGGKIDIAIANSRAIRAEALRCGLANVVVVPLATTVPDPAPEPQRLAPRQLLFAGRLIRYKGLSWFVRNVWPLLDDSYELVVAGEVWDEAEARAIAGKPRITHLGALGYEEVMSLRAGSLACIMPNLPPGPNEQDEGFGLSALEGPAVGTPTIASRCGGLADAVVDGVTGFIVEPLHAQAWADTIRSIAGWSESQRASFASQARSHVLEHFDWRLVARRTLAAIADERADLA